MVTVPPALRTPSPLLLIALLLMFSSAGAGDAATAIPARLLPENTERLIMARPLLPTKMRAQ